MSDDLKKTSKHLSYLLRHKPESIGLELDSNGWANVAQLLLLTDISQDTLEEVVFTNDKQRFAFSPDGKMIRANQGHSVGGVELALNPTPPPEVLYHGTVSKFMESIQEQGLMKMNRHHVHLSATIDTAANVGSRRGKPIVLNINASVMADEGFNFYLSNNGVWLTDEVPVKYIDIETL